MTWLLRFRAIQTVATLCAFALAAACSGPGAGPAAGIVTPAQAQQVVRDYWRLNEQANIGSDPAAWGQIEGGLLQQADVADTDAARKLGLARLAAPRPLRRVSVYVPRQRSYPAEFVALIETVDTDQGGQPTSTPLGFYDHFVRQPGAGGRWIADFAATADLARPMRFALDGDGYAGSLAPQASGYVAQPAALGDVYAAYLSSGVASGTPHGPFVAGSRTTDAVRGARAYQERMTRQGYRISLDYSPPPYVHAYRGADGSAIVLFALQLTNTVQLQDPTTCIVQPADNLRLWGSLVAPGSYSVVASEDLYQLIAIDPAARAGAGVDLVAETNTDQVAVRTIPYQSGRCP